MNSKIIYDSETVANHFKESYSSFMSGVLGNYTVNELLELNCTEI